MPPTYSPWLNSFERLARFGVIRRKRDLGELRTGPNGATDCLFSEDWRRWADARRLFELWGPPQASPWSAFHRPTLFAALESIEPAALWPGPAPGLSIVEAPREAPSWARRDTAILLDMPGSHAVAWAAAIARRAGHEPVATFNNWPHRRGLVDMAETIAALLFFAPWAFEARDRRGSADDPGHAPPVLMLDRRRLGTRSPRPTEFDNRYFLLESDLPTAAMLLRAGVKRVVYARPSEPERAGANNEPDDVNRYLHELGKKLPLALVTLDATSWTTQEPVAWIPVVRKTPFNTVSDPAFRGFKRSAAGGFGELIPEPSSGGG